MTQAYRGRQRSYSSLKAQLEDWVTETEEAMLTVFVMSVNDVIDNAQLPGPSKSGAGQGGRMRVDTGFLRASGIGQVGSMPTGPSVKPADAKPGQYNWANDGVTAALATVKYGDTFYFGWTANYARYRELYDGFMEASLMQWGRIVAFNADSVRRELKK